MLGHKTRMLNAYEGIYSDHYPVSPEFWYYYPAKILNVDMVEYERDVPLWQGILAANKYYNSDGWCIVNADVINPDIEVSSVFDNIGDDRYREKRTINCNGVYFENSNIYSKRDPSWVETHTVKKYPELDAYIRAMLSDKVSYDFSKAVEALTLAGEDILIELNMGTAFTDILADAMGYEETIMFLLSDECRLIEEYYEMFLARQLSFLRQASAIKDCKALFIGNSISNCSLLGPALWRKWDKPYLKAFVEEAHRLGKLVHHHNHGKVMNIVPDLAEIGFDCVCPFERDPGDVDGYEGLVKVRQLLNDKVTFNGNVHTVNTLIFGSPEDVRREVREIKKAFAGTPRLIIGTGDQVGGETPEENIRAMLDEGRKPL